MSYLGCPSDHFTSRGTQARHSRDCRRVQKQMTESRVCHFCDYRGSPQERKRFAHFMADRNEFVDHVLTPLCWERIKALRLANDKRLVIKTAKIYTCYNCTN